MCAYGENSFYTKWTQAKWHERVSLFNDIVSEIQQAEGRIQEASPEGRLEILEELDELYCLIGAGDTWLKYIDEEVSSLQSSDNKRLQIKYLVLQASFSHTCRPSIRGNSQAISKYRMALDAFRELPNHTKEDSLDILNLHIRTGETYWANEDEENALYHFINGLEYAKTLDDTDRLLALYVYMGKIYNNLLQPEASLKYSSAGRALVEMSGDDVAHMKLSTNIGVAFEMQGADPSAQIYLDEALSIYDGMDDNRQSEHEIMSLYQEARLYKARLHRKLKKYKDAEALYEQVRALGTESKDYRFVAEAWNGLARCAFDQENMEDALGKLSKSMNLADSLKYTKLLMENIDFYIGIYSVNNQPADLDQQQRYLILRDSFSKEVQRNKIIHIQTIEDETWETQNLRNRLAQQEVDISRNQMYITLLASALLFLVVVFLLLAIRNKQATNNMLEQKVAERTESLRQANEELDSLAYHTAHDIRGPLARLLGLCEVAINIEGGGKTGNRWLQLINQEAQSMDDMLQQFLNVHHLKNITPSMIKADIGQVLERILNKPSITKHSEGVSVELNIPEKIFVKGDLGMIETILTNVIHNALIYKDPKGTNPHYVRIVHKEDETYHNIHIYDNGMRIPESVSKDIFKLFVRGTNYPKGVGLGLYVAKLITEKLGYHIDYKEENKEETEFLIQFPKTS